MVNLEKIRCIITADEVLLLNSLDNYVLQYVIELQRRLYVKNPDFKWRPPISSTDAVAMASSLQEGNGFNALQTLNAEDRKRALSDGDMFSGSSADDLPFEFRALEVALEAACTFLDTQVG